MDRDPLAVGRLEVADQAPVVHGVVPDIQLGQRRVPAHALAVGLNTGGHCGISLRRVDPVLPRCYHETGGEALDVPLERAGEGFIEVTQVERQVPLRCSPEAEVQDVRIAAELHDQPAVGLRCEVTSHDRRGAPVVVPGRGRHALVPDRNEFADPDVVLGQDRLQRVMPALGLIPVPQRAPLHAFAAGLARCSPFPARGRQIMQRSMRARRGR